MKVLRIILKKLREVLALLKMLEVEFKKIKRQKDAKPSKEEVMTLLTGKGIQFDPGMAVDDLIALIPKE